ncbi:MAG: NAD(P)-dependent alcohol dehydrogenase [Gulosibacter sp.]|uniref:NAD(P)-dependent alcohol dehydrogenase n=1 Tax=Gulosibacter sp. TaxID=2817531 RepID=UPI003F8E98CA
MSQHSPTTTTTMTAWQQRHYGGPETLALEQIPIPSPGRGEVLIKIRATALNAADIRLLHGDPLLVRLAFGLRGPKEPGRGMDAAATVIAIGPDVTGFAIGDEVVGELPSGALAEYAIAPAERLVPRPENLSVETAAALPLAGGTAWQAMDTGRVSTGSRVLVIGASGGVGTYAVQLAAHRGADVWAMCGERNRALVEDLGASRTFDYRTTEIGTLPQDRFDAIIEIAGNAPLRTLRRLLAPGGTLVMVGGDGSRVLGPLPRMLRAALLSIGSKRRLASFLAVAKTEILNELVTLAADGQISPVIERTWPLDQAREAIAHVDAGHTVGKVVVLPVAA